MEAADGHENPAPGEKSGVVRCWIATPISEGSLANTAQFWPALNQGCRNLRIAVAGIAPCWHANPRPFRKIAMVGIAVILNRAANDGAASVFTFATTKVP